MTFRIITILLVIFILQSSSLIAQYSWYENSADVHNLIFEENLRGVLTTNQTNPEINGLNTNEEVSKFVRDGSGNASTTFRFPNAITDISDLTISLITYIEVETSSLTPENSRMHIELRNSTLGSGSISEQATFSVGETWQSFSFDFTGAVIPTEILDAGGYDLIRIRFGVGSNPEVTTYYFDAVEGSISQLDTIVYADFLSGSWGVTFPVFGGERLDSEVAGGYDLVSGAQEIVDELPEVGHIITNLSYFAHSHYFTFSKNANIDLATEIDPSLVPTNPNDEIIFDVLDIFRNSGKRIILYIHVGYMERADSTVQVAWENYYNTNFNGDQYAAYEYMMMGFIEEVKDYVDGYWLDGAWRLTDDGRLDDFHAMIRSTHPDAAISIQGNSEFFRDTNGDFLLVDSDGLDDMDSIDYKIMRFRPQINLGNYTGGHVTPLGQGAPPNSWAYEEYTIPDMVEEPLIDFDGRPIVKHGWFPMRERWHVPSRPLVFVDREQVYRFTRKITDANAGVTFASTTTDLGDKKGYMMADEMVLFKAVNDRLAMTDVPDYEPYVRPEGAYLVGEDPVTNLQTDIHLVDISVFPNPANTELFIDLDLEDTQRVELIMTNYLGQKVKTLTVDLNSNHPIELSVSDLLRGIYFLQIGLEGQGVFTQKISVLNN